MDSYKALWLIGLQRLKENDPNTEDLCECGDNDYIQAITDESWEELGRDIANNTYLHIVVLFGSALNDHKMSSFFRGLTRSSSISEMQLYSNEFSAAGVRSMVPFLQNANNLKYVDLHNNNIQSEGFNMLFRALRDSPIVKLCCSTCGIESIEIDSESIPQNLTQLQLGENKINSDGCREIAKLLQRGNTTLEYLFLFDNMIDDDGVEFLVDALKNNTSLTNLSLSGNDEITVEGMKSCLRLVNDISSINATLQSNHTLTWLNVEYSEKKDCRGVAVSKIQRLISDAVFINMSSYVARVGKRKTIQTQLNSAKRKELADLQGVTRSLYSEINPLHLPEVLALVSKEHGQGELYIALKSSIAGVMSTVNRKQCLKQRRAHHEVRIAEYRAMIAQHNTEVETIDAEIAAIEEADSSDIGTESRSSKRRRA